MTFDPQNYEIIVMSGDIDFIEEEEFEDDEEIMSVTLFATMLFNNICQIEEACGAVFFGGILPFHYKDIIEIEAQDDDVLKFRRVVEKSHYQHFHSSAWGREFKESLEVKAALDHIVEVGGDWEMFNDFWGLAVTISVPKDVDLSANDEFVRTLEFQLADIYSPHARWRMLN